MFFIDKYSPKKSSDATFHRELYELLESFRLNLDEFSQKDQREFMNYANLSKIDKLKKVGRWLKHDN